jgi:hypothetical protein
MGDSQVDPGNEIHWTPELEEYFASTGEKAHCLSWVHKKAEERYSRFKTYIDLPVIVISSITGFVSAGSTNMFPGNQQLATICIGVSSLVVSTLNMTGTYFGWARRAEGHRLSSIHYAKLYRFCLIEMKLPREERKTPHDLLKYVKDQIDNLAEVSPMLPPPIIAEFKRQFDNEKYKEVSKPEEANGLEKITVFGEPDSKRHFHHVPADRDRSIASPLASPPATLPDLKIEIPVSKFSVVNPLVKAASFTTLKGRFQQPTTVLNPIRELFVSETKVEEFVPEPIVVQGEVFEVLPEPAAPEEVAIEVPVQTEEAAPPS